MDQIDESKRKPRRTKGTPFYYIRNRIAIAGILAGSALFALWQLTPIYRVSNEKMLKALIISEEEKERKFLLNLSAVPRSSVFIQDNIDDKKKVFSER